ncbi:MAG TPA: pseudouridine synthase [Prolixibacteraceae bacterium]|nr:pseudouridine synthase [Prolixibacteraceae bacterium]
MRREQSVKSQSKSHQKPSFGNTKKNVANKKREFTKTSPHKGSRPEFKAEDENGEKKKTFQKTERSSSNTKPRKNLKTEKPVAKKGFRPDEKIRLNRFLSNAGVCSRREADTYIQTGCVTVNGKIVSELGSKVSLTDDVRFNGQQLTPERKVYLLLNKPKGYVSTTDDPQERKTVMDLIENACTERIYPVGRLDKDTTGLLLFTNDGDLAKKLTHPGFSRKKIYQVSLDKPLAKNDLLDVARGITLDDGPIAADAINYLDEGDKREIGIEIHSGRNRIVRRIFEHLGYNVVKLDRVYFAGLTKKNLPRGKWRFLTQAEINQLKMIS